MFLESAIKELFQSCSKGNLGLSVCLLCNSFLSKQRFEYEAAAQKPPHEQGLVRSKHELAA